MEPQTTTGYYRLPWRGWPEAERVRRLSWRPTLLLNWAYISPDADPDGPATSPIKKTHQVSSAGRKRSRTIRTETVGNNSRGHEKNKKKRSNSRGPSLSQVIQDQRTELSAPCTLEKHLPTEMIGEILSHLDIPSLLAFSQTSAWSSTQVRALPSLRDLTQHALPALSALARAGVLHHHSLARLHRAFRGCDDDNADNAPPNPNCRSCLTNFGPFLFMPTAERCCFECATKNQALWVVQLEDACAAFGLREAQLLGGGSQAAVMRVADPDVRVVTNREGAGGGGGGGEMMLSGGFVPSKDHHLSDRTGTPRRRDASRLVSVRQAKEVAIRLQHGGDEQRFAEFVRTTGSSSSSSSSTLLFGRRPYYYPTPVPDLRAWLADAPLKPLGIEPCFLAAETDEEARRRAKLEAHDAFSGVAATFFPYLPQSSQRQSSTAAAVSQSGPGSGLLLERGLWCLGCRRYSISEEKRLGFPSRRAVGLEHKAWTRDGFLAHLHSCPGVDMLPRNLSLWRRRYASYNTP